MSRIVIDARELRTSSGRYVERLLHYLQQIDQTNQYQVLLKPADVAGWQPANASFQAVACPHKEFTFAEQTGLKNQLTSLDADLVHFAFPQQPTWYRGRTITTVHDLTTLRFSNPSKNAALFKLKQQVYSRVIKRAAHRSTYLLTPSQFVKDDLVQFASINPDKVTVTYEAADAITEAPQAIPALTDKQFIMYVGRPTPHKNLERLIAAFDQLRARHPNLHLVLVGEKDANYQRIERNLTNTAQILFTDFATEGQLRWLYEHCAAYVFPSLSEGFGLPGLEAMVHGAPVVSSTATCLPEVYGAAAHYFDPTDTQAMANAIDQVLNDANLRQQLIKAGHAQAAQYSWQRLAQQTLSVYENALRTSSST